MRFQSNFINNLHTTEKAIPKFIYNIKEHKSSEQYCAEQHWEHSNPRSQTFYRTWVTKTPQSKQRVSRIADPEKNSPSYRLHVIFDKAVKSTQ